MKLLFCLILCSNLAQAQPASSAWDSAFVKVIDGLPSKEPFDTAHAYRKINSPYVYISSDNDLYNLFGYDLSMKFRNIGFGQYHILGQYQCRQCLTICLKDNEHTECHRNRCMLSWVWVLRDNKKAFTAVLFQRMPGLSKENSAAVKYHYGDTVLRSSADTGKATWITHSGGDCFATFEFGLFRDNHYPVLLLKEWNYYGGCRAGGGWQFAFEFDMPAGILHYYKNVLLMKMRNGKEEFD